MSVLELQEMPLVERDGEQTVLPGNDAMVIPTPSNLSLVPCDNSTLSLLLC
jgi:hypothetical protein